METMEWVKNNKIYIFFFFFILIKGLLWTLVIPPLRTPDEDAHFAYVQYLAEEKKVPRNIGKLKSTQLTTSEELEKTIQLIRESALMIFSSMDQKPKNIPNEFISYSRKVPPGEYKNAAALYPPLYYLYETIPYLIGAKLDIFHRIYLMRFFSLIFYLITIIFIYKIAFLFSREKNFSHTVTLMATFLPAVSSAFSGINNDVALFAFSHIMIYYLSRYLMLPKNNIKTLVRQGVILGIALLTKTQALIFIPLIIFAHLPKTNFWKLKNFFKVIKIFLVAGFIALPFAILPLFDYFQNNIVAELADKKISGGIGHPEIIKAMTEDLFRRKDLFFAFWSQIQTFDAHFPPLLAIATGGLALVAIWGLIIYFIFNNKKGDIPFVLFFLACFLALELFYTMLYYRTALTIQYYAFPGWSRYYFVVLGPLLILYVLGLKSFAVFLKIPTKFIYIILILFFIFLHNYVFFNAVLQYNYL